MSSTQIMYSMAVVLTSAGILLLAKMAYTSLSSFDVDHELTEADNPAVGTALFGFLAAVVIVLAALLATEPMDVDDNQGMFFDLIELIYGALAVVLVKIAGLVNDRFILHKFENKKELVDDRNVGAGVLGGSYIASDLVVMALWQVLMTTCWPKAQVVWML